MVEDSELVRPHFSVPNGAGAFDEVTYLSSLEDDDESFSFLTEAGTAQMAINLLPFFQHLVLKREERRVAVVMRHAGFKLDQMGIRKEQYSWRVHCIQRKRRW